MRKFWETEESTDSIKKFVTKEFIEAEELHSKSKREISSLFIRDMMNREEGNAIPDTTATDEYFIEGFLTEEMWNDFGDISRDFLKHHYADIEAYDSLNSYEIALPEQTDPVESLKLHMLSLMYKAAKSGDEYSIKLFQYLYKTYYKKEYQQLKRFRKISVSEIFSLSENENGSVVYKSMARIIGMCEFFNIEIEDAVSVLHLLFDRDRKTDEEDESKFFEFPEGLYAECLEKVDQWLDEEIGGKDSGYFARYYDRLERFVGLCFRRYGYPEDYVYRCNPCLDSPDRAFSITLALLKSAFPRENFTYKEVQIFSHILQIVETFVYTCDNYYENMVELLGIPKKREYFEEQSLFKPENIIVKKENVKPVKKENINTVPVKKEIGDESIYIEEIAQLRKKLRETEQESTHYKQQYHQSQKTVKELQDHLLKYKNDREELIALRSYAYSLSEEETDISEICLEEMKADIQKKEIAIIGGHTNWINKVKKEFPRWKFFDANVSRLSESMVLAGTEKVYFFTNHLSHSIYGKYITLIRENKIPIGYLHSINLETIIKQIYKDLKA